MDYVWGKGDVVLADGRAVASASRSWVRERAEVDIDGVAWRFGATGSDRVAETGGLVRMRARRRSIWTSRYDIDTSHSSYSLGAPSIWTTRLVLSHGEEPIGAVRRSRMWTNRPELTTSKDLPPEDAVFVLWLAFLIARRSDSAA
ncbi:hypothetical protein [Nocardioides terrigena]|uniref:hypothetical protein n=1 Tax=Nocardioides terrigena TaxID=424797 RepID=UPI000D326879|nr:hypothetical protein [Nocardioides terrigena]